jgi:hypothetical protein
MAKRRAGIYDPWRQGGDEPEVVPREPVAVDTVEATAPPAPVRFAGRRAGVTVWLPGDTEDFSLQAQTNVLAAVQSLMQDTELFPIFRSWEIYGPDLVAGISERTVMSDGTRTITVIGDYHRAMDAVAFALREAARKKETVARYLASLGIKPYII